MLLRELFLTAEFFQIIQRITLPGKDPVHCNLPHHIVDLATGKIVVLGKEHCVIFIETVSSKVDFHQSGIEKGTRERVRSKVTKFGYHYKFLSSF